MASRDSLQTRKYLAQGAVVAYQGINTPVALELRYVGTGTITSVIVTTADNIEMITSDGGTDTYLFADHATLGALADAITADGIFQARVVGSLRSDASASRLLGAPTTYAAVTNADGNVIYKILLDTSAALQYAVCLSPFVTFDSPKGHRVKLQEIKYGITMTTAAVDSVQVWKRQGKREWQVAGWLSVQTTVTTINWASGDGFLSGKDNEEIIVLVKDAAQLDDAAANYLQVVGQIE